MFVKHTIMPVMFSEHCVLHGRHFCALTPSALSLKIIQTVKTILFSLCTVPLYTRVKVLSFLFSPVL